MDDGEFDKNRDKIKNSFERFSARHGDFGERVGFAGEYGERLVENVGSKEAIGKTLDRMYQERDPLLDKQDFIFFELYGGMGHEKQRLLTLNDKMRRDIKSNYLMSETPEKEELKNHIAESLKFIRDNDITKVFSTVRGSVYEGFLLKEAFKKAFPNETPPAFYNVVPYALAGGVKGIPTYQQFPDGKISMKSDEVSPVVKENIKKFLEKRLDQDDKIWILEGKQEGASGKSKKMVEDTFNEWSKENNLNLQIYTNQPEWNFLSDDYKVIYPVNKGNLTGLKWGVGRSFSTNHPVTGVLPYNLDRAIEDLKKGYVSVAGTVTHDKILQKSARANIKSTRQVGEEIGREIRKENLETKVGGSVGVMGILASLLFLSSNITGNIIGNLTSSASNIIGVVFFIVGLVASFFYLRKRK